MITYFARGSVVRNGKHKHVVFLSKAHSSMIHRGQRFYIEDHDFRVKIVHGPSGMSCRSVLVNAYDREEDIVWRIRKHLDENWDKILNGARKRKLIKFAYRW